jgi:hypothetical protein
MRVPHLVTALLLGITFFVPICVVSAIPAVAENTLPAAKSVDVPEKVQVPRTTECIGKKCRKLAHKRVLRRRSPPPIENPCPPHNPEQGPPCATPQR